MKSVELFLPSDASLRFVIHAFEIRNGVKANDDDKVKLCESMLSGFRGLCSTIGDGFVRTKVESPSYAITDPSGSFTSVMIDALVFRIHCLKEDKEAFGLSMGLDVRSFVQESTEDVSINPRTHLELRGNIIFIVPTKQ